MKGSGHLPDLGADGKMILNWDLKETGIGMQTEFIWIKIGFL